MIYKQLLFSDINYELSFRFSNNSQLSEIKFVEYFLFIRDIIKMSQILKIKVIEYRNQKEEHVMKKILSLLLSAIFVLPLFSAPSVFAAEIYEEDFMPGVVVAGVEFDAPPIETLLADFEIEEANETGASCVHNTYLVKFKEKTKEIVLRAIDALEKSPYVLYASPEYIYQDEGVEPSTLKPATDDEKDYREDDYSEIVPGRVIVNLEYDAPSVETLLEGFEIEEIRNIFSYCNNDTFLVIFKEKTEDIVHKAIDVLEKSPYVLYAEPDGYIYPDDDSTENPVNAPKYEDKFLEKYYDKDSAENYSYSELYYHKDSNEEIDWVLVRAYIEPFGDMFTSATVGNRFISSNFYCKPFITAYGIYNVKEDKFYDIISYNSANVKTEDLEAVLKQRGIGTEFNGKYEGVFLDRYKSDFNIDSISSQNYHYSELYYHKDSGEKVDWVLVKGSFGMEFPAETDIIVGNLKIHSNSILSPFITGYGVYDVKENEFYDINDYQNVEGKLDELVSVLKELNIGKEQKFYSQEFCDALNNYLKDIGLYDVYCWDSPFIVDSLKAKDSIITLYEETDDTIIFNIKGANSAPGEDIIGDYKFFTTSLFSGGSSDDTNCGHCVYKDGKIYGIKTAVKNGIVTVEHLAQVIPDVTRINNNPTEAPAVNPNETYPKVTEPTQPAKTAPAVKAKQANPIKVTAKTKNVKAKKLKKKAQTVKAITVKNAQGKVTYKLVKSGISKKIRKLVKINSKGVITIKKWKNAKKGAYKIKVSVTAKGNTNYKAKTITKTVKVKVK